MGCLGVVFDRVGLAFGIGEWRVGMASEFVKAANMQRAAEITNTISAALCGHWLPSHSVFENLNPRPTCCCPAG